VTVLRGRTYSLETWLTVGAVAAATIGSFYLAFASSYSGDTNGTPTSTTLIQENGAWVSILLAIPVALSLLPIAVKGKAHRAALRTVTVFLVISMFITVIGVFYLPTGLLLILAWWAESRSRAA
jgi:hypothetical protein